MWSFWNLHFDPFSYDHPVWLPANITKHFSGKNKRNTVIFRPYGIPEKILVWYIYLSVCLPVCQSRMHMYILTDVNNICQNQYDTHITYHNLIYHTNKYSVIVHHIFTLWWTHDHPTSPTLNEIHLIDISPSWHMPPTFFGTSHLEESLNHQAMTHQNAGLPWSCLIVLDAPKKILHKYSGEVPNKYTLEVLAPQ